MIRSPPARLVSTSDGEERRIYSGRLAAPSALSLSSAAWQGQRARLRGSLSSLCLVPECPPGLAERSGDGPTWAFRERPGWPVFVRLRPCWGFTFASVPVGPIGGITAACLIILGLGSRMWLQVWASDQSSFLQGGGGGGVEVDAKGLVDHPRTHVHHHANSNMSKQE